MKFEDSKWEKSANKYWNNEIVPTHKNINKLLKNQTKSLFSTTENLEREVANYMANVTTLVDLLQEYISRVSDTTYLNQYIESIVNSAYKDLESYEEKASFLAGVSTQFLFNYASQRSSIMAEEPSLAKRKF